MKLFDKTEKERSNIKYAKEYFVSPKGQVIKFAAIISHEEDIRE